MFKKIARYILKDEIGHLEREIEDQKTENKDAEKSLSDKRAKICMLHEQLTEKENTIKKLTERIDDLEHQNAIMSEFYDIQNPPSDETKYKILMNLKYREQEKELIKLQTTIATQRELANNDLYYKLSSLAKAICSYQSFYLPSNQRWNGWC